MVREQEQTSEDSFNEENSRQKSSLHSLISEKGGVRDNVFEYLHFLLGLFARNPPGLLEFLPFVPRLGGQHGREKLTSSRAPSRRRSASLLSLVPPFSTMAVDLC